jgi:hypothetical protein
VTALTAVVSIALPSFAAGEKTGPRKRFRSIEYRTLELDRFQSFIKNWDSKKHPVLCARISKPEEWDAVFDPAPVMGPRRQAFAPAKEVYRKEQLLLVARVVEAAGEKELKKLFQVQKITANGEELVVRYRFRKSRKPASFTMKHALLVLVPRHDYKKIKFVENGKAMGTLNLARGQWSVPEMKPKKGSKEGKTSK